MATVTKKSLARDTQFGGATPYGNRIGLLFSLVTNSSGVMTDSNQTTALVQGDVVRVGVIPGGTTLVDCLSMVNDAFTASETAKVGFQYVDGVDSTAVPQDDDYFHTALALSAAGRTRANNTAVQPVTLPKDAYLIVTIAGADTAAAGRVDFAVEGIATGMA